MVVETLWPETAPWWLSLFIWMALFWQYILVAFIPAFYVAIVKLFGMPLLQRWSNEVVVMLYPSKVKFGKITQQYEPYIRYKEGVYWLSKPLQPVRHEEISPKYHAKLNAIKERYEQLAKKEIKTDKDEKDMKSLLKQQMHIEKQMLVVNPVNQVHIFTHAVNQEIYDMKRRQTKVDEILNNKAKPKKISNHGIWIMQNPKLHFHRHYQFIVDPTSTMYQIVPVKDRQQYSIGFWHSLGIVLQRVEKVEKQIEVESGGGEGTQIIQTLITTDVILQLVSQVQDYQNFSASRAFMLLKRRSKIEEQFMMWIKGTINPLIFIVLGGAVAVIAALYFFMHGSGPPPTTPPGIHPIL